MEIESASLMRCGICALEKPLSQFQKRKDRPSYRPSCRSCISQAMKVWRQQNPERVKANNDKRPKKTTRANRKLGIAAVSKASYAAQRYEMDKQRLAERYRANAAKWLKANPDKAAAKKAERRARKLRAQPAWANKFFISEAYHLAQLRTRVTGRPWEVDHIVPLKSDIVCGLHVEHNLAVIPAVINASKGNRYWPDMP